MLSPFVVWCLCSMLEDWKISDKVLCGTTDNGQNIVNAIGLLGIEHFPCIAHTLQLAIMKALQVPKVESTIAQCKKLVEHFKKSSKESYKLREKQVMLQLPQHQLMQECPTRWRSTLSMLKRLGEQQAAIAAVLMEGNVRYLMPEGGDWTVIEELVNILEPFQKVTEVMSTEKYPTISSVKHKLLERVLKVEDSDSSISKQMKKEIKSDLAGRYQSSELKTVLNVTTFLDPRYKELPFVSDSDKEKVLEQVEEELLGMYSTSNRSSQDNESKEEAATGDSEPPAKKSRKGDKGPMTALLGDLFSKDVMPKRLGHSEKVKRELSLYKAEHSAELD